MAAVKSTTTTIYITDGAQPFVSPWSCLLSIFKPIPSFVAILNSYDHCNWSYFTQIITNTIRCGAGVVKSVKWNIWTPVGQKKRRCLLCSIASPSLLGFAPLIRCFMVGGQPAVYFTTLCNTFCDFATIACSNPVKIYLHCLSGELVANYQWTQYERVVTLASCVSSFTIFILFFVLFSFIQLFGSLHCWSTRRDAVEMYLGQRLLIIQHCTYNSRVPSVYVCLCVMTRHIAQRPTLLIYLNQLKVIINDCRE